MKRRRLPLREGNSSSPLPPDWIAPSTGESPPDWSALLPSPVSLIYVIHRTSWWRTRFATHPNGGYPEEVYRSQTAAQARCEQLNREHRLTRNANWGLNCPLSSPPRGAVLMEGEEGYTESWAEDELCLLVLRDYVQDLGLPAPTEATAEAWRNWWQSTQPTLEPWQVEAIWAFLDREPAFRVSEIECES